MRKTNQHIENYLDYYCNFKEDIQFAILLKGKWGCGKTYFIKNYISRRENKKILHVSLYGIDSFNGVKEKIIIELIPFIPEKYSKFTGSIVKTLRRIPKIRDWVPTDIDELLVDIFLKKNKECIFVFDDLERCRIDIDKILGYINNFVEFKSQKVIIIANEEDLLNSENGGKYRKIKEKLIGKEFCINSSYEEAIITFVEKLKDKDLTNYSEDLKEILRKIFVQSKYDNLRLTQQALFSFEYFFKSFSSKSKNNRELFNRIFYEFVVIFIEYKKGNIKSEDFFKEYPQFFKGSSDTKKDDHFLNKYEYGLSTWLTCFDVKILGKILQGIDLSKDEKKGMVNKLENLASINKESWQKLWYCYDQSDDDFFDNLIDVQKKWINKNYLDFYVILHIYGMFLVFSENGLLQKDKKNIYKEGKQYIEYLIQKKKFPLDLREQNMGSSWRQSAYGLGYSGMENKEWETLIKFIDAKLVDLKEISIKEKIEKELMPILREERNMNQDLDLFMNYNFLHYEGNKEAYFQYFDIDEIVKILVKGNRSLLHDLQKTFIERFGNMKTQIKGIEHEMPFLKKLKKKLNSEIKKIEKKFGDKKTPKSFILRSFINKAINPFIK